MRFVLLLVITAACSKAPDPAAMQDPPPFAESSRAANLEAVADEICACTSVDCVARVQPKANAMMREPLGPSDDATRFTAASNRIAGCLSGGGSRGTTGTTTGTTRATGPSASVAAHQQFADQACACKDLPCLEGVLANVKTHVTDWGTTEEAAAIKASMERGQACDSALRPKAGTAVTGYAQLAEEVCACKDLPCLEGATRKGEAIMKAHAGAEGTPAEADAIRKAGERMQGCTTRLVESLRAPK
jgi:hypothetical protein